MIQISNHNYYIYQPLQHYQIIIIMSTTKEQLRLIRESQPISQDQADKKKYVSLQFQYKNEDDFDHIQNTSPTQNLVIDESTLFNQQKRRCSLCLQVQKRLLTIEYELECQKKKNARYLKIINTRRDKQKELQQAYYQIAKELQKKIQALSKYQTKQVNQQIQGSNNQEIRISMKEKQLLLVSKNIDLQFLLKKSNNFKIINFQIIKQSMVSPYEQDQAEVQKFLLDKQQSGQQQLLKQSNHSEANFYSIKNSQLSRSLQQFATQQHQDKVNNSQVSGYKRQSSYYSISEQLQINQISNVLIKSSISSEQADKNIEKELLKELSPEVTLRENGPSNILQYSFREGKARETANMKIEQTNKQRERTVKLITNVNNLLDGLSKQLNTYGQKYKIYYSIPFLIGNKPLQPPNQIQLEDALALGQNIEQISKIVLQQMQKIFKCSKRQYEKMMNDKELSIYDLKTKIHQLQSQQARYQKIIQNQQIHKTMLSIKIIDLQKRLKAPYHQMSSKRSQLLHQNNVSEQQKRDQQTQCQLVPMELLKTNQNLQHKNKELINAINSIPSILNAITSNKSFRQYNHILNFQNNLQEQLQSILRDCLSHKNIASQSNFNINTTESIVESHIAIANQRKPSQNQKVIDMLKRENQQLKDSLKNKLEQLLKCSEKITLQKIEKSNLDKNIENLNIKIQHLNKLLQQRKENNFTVQSNHIIGLAEQHGEFAQYHQKQQYNLHSDRDRELKELQFKVQTYQAQLIKLRVQGKKNKKIIYIDK